jgi:hypothetical protein
MKTETYLGPYSDCNKDDPIPLSTTTYTMTIHSWSSLSRTVLSRRFALAH